MQTASAIKREDLPLHDLFTLANNGTDRWLIQQAFNRGREFEKKQNEEAKGL